MSASTKPSPACRHRSGQDAWSLPESDSPANRQNIGAWRQKWADRPLARAIEIAQSIASQNPHAHPRRARSSKPKRGHRFADRSRRRSTAVLEPHRRTQSTRSGSSKAHRRDTRIRRRVGVAVSGANGSRRKRTQAPHHFGAGPGVMSGADDRVRTRRYRHVNGSTRLGR